jgi:hypothetical protein
VSSPRTQFDTDGYYISDGPIVPSEMVVAAVQGMDAIRAGRYDRGRQPLESRWKPGDDPNLLCKIEQPQFVNQAIFDLVRTPALGQLAAEVTGAAWVQIWWAQLLYKPSAAPEQNAPTAIGWHQDRSYWSSWKDESRLFTAWLALSDVEANCGPMRFLRGSHRWGHQEGLSAFDDGDLDRQREAITQRGLAWDEVPVLLPAGGVSFHDRLTFHGSDVNESGRPRRSLAIHMRTEQSEPNPESDNRHCDYLDDPSLCPAIYGSWDQSVREK